jgi:metalloendopeptidase OMA1, mitochondrial
MKRISVTFTLFAATIFMLSGCTTVQETGRKQLIFTSPAQEAQLGLEAFREIKSKEKISSDPALNARIQLIGKRIADSVGRDLPNAEWEFVVFDAPTTVNAFALPGGKVGVYTGLINLAGKNEDEIAVVIGHEVAHVTSRHGGERQSQAILVGTGGNALSIGAAESKNRDLYLLAYNGVSTLGVLAYSRSHETEADVVGLNFAARAGYDPRAGAAFWRKMEKLNTGAQPLKWFSTHPPSAERIANLEKLALELMPVYEKAKASATHSRTISPASPPTVKAATNPPPIKPVTEVKSEKQELEEFLKR